MVQSRGNEDGRMLHHVSGDFRYAQYDQPGPAAKNTPGMKLVEFSPVLRTANLQDVDS
jgi:hypothetical protein